MTQDKPTNPENTRLTPAEEDQSTRSTVDIKKAVKEAADIAETVSELYRLKCFEILLSHFLSGSVNPPARIEKGLSITSQAPQKPVIRLEVKALLQQYSVPEDIVLKIFFVDGQVVPTYTIKDIDKMKTSRVQIVLALLIALETALKSGKFEFSVEEVRKKCKESQRYDANNFKGNFNNSKELFTNPANEETIELSSPGKTELADVLLELVK